MTGIEASLKTHENLHIIRMGKSLVEAAMEMKMVFPHAVIFEMRDAKQSDIVTFLHEYPHIRLIGLDPERDAITLFSVREQKVSSVDELAQILFKCTGEQEQQKI
jgi:uncharacterized protein involved in propanediol utilization